MFHSRRRERLPTLALSAIAGLAAASLAPGAGIAQIIGPPPDAQTQTSPTGQKPQPQPNIKNGETIATVGRVGANGQPSFACYTCHGRNGEGSAQANIPRLAGQSYPYLYGALKAFASGQWKNATMEEVAKTLDDEAMRDVAGYYATRPPPPQSVDIVAQKQTTPGPDAVRQGGLLAAYGDMHRGIQGCVNCHGPQGRGEPPTYPYLAGQYAGYLTKQLADFKSGARQYDLMGIMHDIATRLTDQQIAQVAQYYASIRPSKPVPQSVGGKLMPPPAPPPEAGLASAAAGQQPIAGNPANGPAP